MTFASRLDVTNGAAQKRIGGKSGAVRSADRQFRSLVTRLQKGSLSQEEFLTRFSHTLQVAHERAYSIGFAHGGGGSSLTQRGEGYVASTVASEGQYAADLAAELADGSVSLKAGLARARQYANRVRGSANAAFREASEEGGYTLTWNVVSADPCEECPRYASMSPWQPNELPTTPGEGDTPCRANCKCSLTRSDGRQGFGPVDFTP